MVALLSGTDENTDFNGDHTSLVIAVNVIAV